MFLKLFLYFLISLCTAFFLNPQQTKYFGGLAVSIKQAGFFAEYKTATHFVYFSSWFFIGLFCFFSIWLCRFL